MFLCCNDVYIVAIINKKTLDFISPSALIADATQNQELYDATKLVQDFHNPELLLDESEDFVENERESNLDFADSESLFSKAYTEEEQEESYFDGETRFFKVTQTPKNTSLDDVGVMMFI